MMKKLVYISILSLLLLSSCRSKRMITVSLPQPVMQADSTQLGDTIGLPARLSPMFTFDQSDLRNVRRQPAKGEVKKQQIKKTAPVQKVIVQRGTRITSKTTHVGSAYKGVSRIKTYDFTHRDVPAAFEGFRIAFVSDLHYKSLLKEEGLKDLVRLLIDQKADVLLIGGDFHEGCQYVPPVMAALAQVKTPLGTYAVLGNNDYEACYDDIVREMRHYGMHLLEHKVDTLRRGVVLVTHRLEEIPAGFDHIAIMGRKPVSAEDATNDGIDAMGNPSAGTIVYTGPLEAGLTDERLSELFGMPIEVQHTHGRWSAFAV